MVVVVVVVVVGVVYDVVIVDVFYIRRRRSSSVEITHRTCASSPFTSSSTYSSSSLTSSLPHSFLHLFVGEGQERRFRKDAMRHTCTLSIKRLYSLMLLPMLYWCWCSWCGGDGGSDLPHIPTYTLHMKKQTRQLLFIFLPPMYMYICAESSFLLTRRDTPTLTHFSGILFYPSVID